MSDFTFLSVKELPIMFQDVTPVPQNEPEGGSVARIDYPNDFRMAYDYQRALWKSNEIHTDRALQLTALCLKFNPANYTVWHFRRLCLDQLYGSNTSTDNDNNNNCDLSYIDHEMLLASVLGGDNPKNYQIWYHRRVILEKLTQSNKTILDHNSKEQIHSYYRKELQYIANVLVQDGKNYHAWSQRQWVITTLANSLASSSLGKEEEQQQHEKDTSSVWEDEMIFVDQLIQNDVRNNSAWNQRWFTSHHGGGGGGAKHVLDEKTALCEADYALLMGRMDPHNESSWRYLFAIIKEQVHTLKDGDKITSLLFKYYEKIYEIETNFFQEHHNNNHTDSNTTMKCIPNLTTILIDLLEYIGDPTSIRKAIELAKGLATKYDVIRQRYWNLRISKLEMKL